MSAARVASDVALATGVAAQLVCCVGVWWMRDVFDRLHFAAAGTTVGPVLIGVSVALSPFSSPSGTVQALAALLFLVVLNPVLTHATGRAARHRVLRDSGPPSPQGPPENGHGSSGTPPEASG
ncbi:MULTISPECIES: monovalent cation/H(+) antiporter subunit G [unclassified Streptomyces]|uniref:monovalent cation/H(+) antiporter subunit G n=1 Tax=unclassified Streptomyces TaxID=2593676 RepID=UPI0027417C4E|nr:MULTISPECIES: monovalent cation/H(+) antiporter subunit G [unclassified Streptomyces]